MTRRISKHNTFDNEGAHRSWQQVYVESFLMVDNNRIGVLLPIWHPIARGSCCYDSLRRWSPDFEFRQVETDGLAGLPCNRDDYKFSVILVIRCNRVRVVGCDDL